MKEAIKSKMDEHIMHILDKPAITNEDYALLGERLREIMMETRPSDPFLPLIMLALLGKGGQING